MGVDGEPLPSGRLDLSDVAVTGLLTAFCHAIESRRADPILRDAKAEAVADRLAPALAEAPDRLARNLARGKVRDDLVVHIVLRARQYDHYAKQFSRRHEGCLVVNLGSGLDTRFFRIDDGSLTLFDVDLPEVIALKRRLLPETDRYRMIGRSVLDHGWMDEVAAAGGPCIFLAEGLFMYLPAGDVKALVLALQERYPGGELVFETVNAAWLKPWLKWMIDVKLQKQIGLGRGTEYRFGIGDSNELEQWSPGLRFLEDWVYLDVDEPRIGPIRHFRWLPLLRRTQWTVRYALEAPPAPP